VSSRQIPVLKLVVVAIGALMILISLALPWYSGRYIGFGVRWLLLPKHWKDDEPLVGLVLPVVFIVIFAAFTLASALWSMLKGKLMIKLLILMGILAIVALVFNAVFYSWYVQRPFVRDFESGFVLALIGTITIVMGAYLARIKSS
jgi:hypothetical protein